MGKPKSVKPPKVPDPAPMPVESTEPEDQAVKKARSRSGFQRTMITGGLTPQTGKKTTLG